MGKAILHREKRPERQPYRIKLSEDENTLAYKIGGKLFEGGASLSQLVQHLLREKGEALGLIEGEQAA